MNNILSHIWFRMQKDLFPHLETELSPLSDKERKLVSILELIRVEEYVIPFSSCKLTNISSKSESTAGFTPLVCCFSK